MDVVLINGMYFSAYSKLETMHIGQFILRDILKKNYSVECINFDYMNQFGEIQYKDSWDENIKIMGDCILDKNPKIVGFYTICTSFLVTIKLADYIKNQNPEIIVIFGGAQATIIAEECLGEFEFVDVIALGESELIIENLINSYVLIFLVPIIHLILKSKIHIKDFIV